MKKEKQEVVHEAEPINALSTIKASALIDVSAWEKKQKKLVAENKFFKITDNKTYESAKKCRTNVVKGRTELQNQEKLVVSKFTAIRKEVGTGTETLIKITKPLEDKWQDEVKAWEDRKEREKEEADNAEALRIKTITDKIEEFETKSYEIIQKMVFSTIDFDKQELIKLEDNEFDFEEYDIMLDQVNDRLVTACETKVKTLTDNENQRLDNIRLEQENAEAKRKSDLQAARLTEIMPYVAFGVAIDLTKLSEMKDDEYAGHLNSKKGLFEAKVKLDEEAETARKEKEEEEKDAVYEIRKKRLEESGMIYSDEHNSFWTKLDTEFIILEHDVYNEGTLEFENTLVEVKKVIEREQRKIAVQEERKSKLAEIGMFENEDGWFTNSTSDSLCNKESVYYSDDNSFDELISDSIKAIKIGDELRAKEVFDAIKNYLFALGFVENNQLGVFELKDIWSVYYEQISKFSVEDFQEYSKDILSAIKEYNDKKSKADAEKLKTENKARIKKYSTDKKALTKFVKSLEFRTPVPELENENLQPVLDNIILELENTRGNLLTNINIF